jgi:hypothetical protein
MKEITFVCVVHNTLELFKNCYESIRKFHPDTLFIIVDGSDINDPCRAYVESLVGPYNMLMLCPSNMGHGRGMDLAISQVKTKYALIFDSDIIMVKSPVQEMIDLMEPDTYGVGYLEKTGLDGYEYGAHANHKNEDFMMMMHPFFHLLQVSEYYKFAPYVQHGAPCYKAALDIHRHGLSSKIYKVFPGLGHTHGQGWCWTAVPGTHIIHDTAGTRKDRVRRGKSEIEGGWDYTPLPEL